MRERERDRERERKSEIYICIERERMLKNQFNFLDLKGTLS